MSIVIKFISCLFSFTSIIFSFLFALRYKKVRFVNLGLVQLFFFSISLEALYSSVYGVITNHLFLFLFGSFCAVCFAYGIINFSLDLVNVNVKAFIRFIPLIYVATILVLYLILEFVFSFNNISFYFNLLGIWVPSGLAVLIDLIFIKRINKGIFQKEKWLILGLAVCNIVLSIFIRLTPFFFIISVSILEIVIFYKFYFSVPVKQNTKELSKAFIKDFAITPREQEILKELLNGKSNKELAEIFFVTQKTIEAHLGNIYRKVGVKNRFELFSRLQND